MLSPQQYLLLQTCQKIKDFRSHFYAYLGIYRTERNGYRSCQLIPAPFKTTNTEYGDKNK